MEKPWIVYGAGGVTGRLIVSALLGRGIRPVVAGRSPASLETVARKHNLAVRFASLDDPASLTSLAASASLVINAAGPFVRTARPIAEACIRVGTPYVDVNGEVRVFRDLETLDGDAKAAGVPLLCGAGYGVAVGECLALHLAERLPGAVDLWLGLDTYTEWKSPGAMRSTFEVIGAGGYVMAGGKLEPAPVGRDKWRRNFEGKVFRFVGAPLAEAWAAWHSTRIPDVRAGIRTSVAGAYALPLLRALLAVEGVRRLALRSADGKGPSFPSLEGGAKGRSVVLGEARDAAGRRAAAAIVTHREGYEAAADIVAHAAIAISERKPSGFLTPGGAFGADFILTVPGFERTDLE